MKPPKTARMATRGIMALMPSAPPRLVSSVLSVSQALKAASLAVEPKKVMIQSRTMTRDTPTAAAEAAMGKTDLIQPSFRKMKQRMDTPQRI